MGQEDGDFFFFNDTATTEIYTLSLHDALPIRKCPDEDEPRKRKCPDEDEFEREMARVDEPDDVKIGRAHV